MQKKLKRHLMSFILCMALIVATAFTTTGCNGKTDTPSTNTEQNSGDAQKENVTLLGEGALRFDFTVTDKEGTETLFEIHTDKETVGEALLEAGLIAGEEGPYGLYVKTVNGITADFEKDGVYWAFYINGEYAATSVDTTKITEGDHYSFKEE